MTTSATKYSYTVLRYVHDAVTGEFFNVGVALYAPEASYLGALCRTTYSRITAAFPGLNGEHFRAVMRHLQARFEEFGEQMHSTARGASTATIQDIARSILPADDSSLQWGTVGVGLTSNPSQQLELLFDRLVMKYDSQVVPKSRRSDDDVWRLFKRDLEQRRLLKLFEPKIIAVQDDEVQFEHAWKNGIWHCLEPISFDLAAAEAIKDKAHKLLGQITSIQGAEDKFRLYMLVAKPGDSALLPAYESALSILTKVPSAHEIVQEDSYAKLADRLAEEVQRHPRGQVPLA